MNQLAMTLPMARDAAADGIRRSAEHAEEVLPGWTAAAYRLLYDYATTTGEFTSEMFRAHLDRIRFPVAVPKALGSVFRKAVRIGIIRKSERAGIALQRHGSPCPVWESLVYRRAA